MTPIDPMALLAESPPEPAPKVDPWRIRLIRTARGMTQADLADACGWTTQNGHQTVCRIESYAVGVGTDRAEKLAAALAVDAADLCSPVDRWQQNQGLFFRWRADGSPDLRQWCERLKASK